MTTQNRWKQQESCNQEYFLYEKQGRYFEQLHSYITFKEALQKLKLFRKVYPSKKFVLEKQEVACFTYLK